MSLLRRGNLVVAVVVMAAALTAGAELAEDEKVRLLHEANAAFRQANAQVDDPARARQLYEKAILTYERIVSEGHVENAKLYYNVANAYLLKEDVGRAILLAIVLLNVVGFLWIRKIVAIDV